MISAARLSLLLVAAAVSGLIFQSPRFEPVQPDVLTASGSFVNAAADFDLDGDPDLFVGFNGAANRLLRNTKGTFVDVARDASVADTRPTRAAAWGDFDADGDPDLLVGFAPGTGPVLRLYRNDRGRFNDVTSASGLVVGAGAVRQPSWIDFDADGDLDLFVGFRDRADVLFRNDHGLFTDIAPGVGLADPRRTVGAVWFDYDEDGDLDLYAAHMDGDANGLYRNDGGKFTDVAESAGVAWAGRAAREASNGTVRPCVADVNGDGHLDLFAANYGPNGLFLNGGGSPQGTRFEDLSRQWGVVIDARYDTCAFDDVDNDGRIDLYVNGTVTGGVSHPDYLLRNTGSKFEDVTPANIKAIASDHGAIWWDYDADGMVDLSLTGVGAVPLPLLLRNVGERTDAQGLSVRVVDRRGRSILAGAEVRIYRPGTRTLLGARLVDTGSGYNSQSDVPLHFGLGTARQVDVEVIYPNRGSRRARVFPKVKAGTTLRAQIR
jgi:hypothetical protein